MHYNHQYHQALVYKIFMAKKSNPEPVTTFDEALEIIKGMCQVTRGLKQIVYLVGWQYEGHDSKYPAWFQCNARLAGKDDADPREAFRRLFHGAKAYNAVVSLHINMDDAYENSPLWQEYVEKDLIIKDAKGELLKGDVWDGERCHYVSKTREWNAGLAQRRIDQLLAYMPELVEAGTIHIDVFRSNPSAFHGVSVEDETSTVKQLCHYWGGRGLDVTCEYLCSHEFVGHIPMVWALNLDEQSRLRYPPSLLCGGSGNWNKRVGDFHKPVAWSGFFFIPEAGTRYEEAWGRSCSCDVCARASLGMVVADMLKEFCAKALPWLFLNQHRALELRQTAATYEVVFSDGVTSAVRVADRSHRITRQGRVMVEDGDCFLPASWAGGMAYIAWSAKGTDRTWQCPPEWGAVARVRVTEYDHSGTREPCFAETAGGAFALRPRANAAYLVEPVGLGI